jgi:hypothetical protein
MDNDPKERQDEAVSITEQALMDRRGFLHSLQKWSKIVIGGALASSILLNSSAEVEGAGWANRGGGGGGAWANHAGGGGVVVRPGGSTAWANRVGSGGAAWANRGAAWANRGSAWVNRF